MNNEAQEIEQAAWLESLDCIPSALHKHRRASPSPGGLLDVRQAAGLLGVSAKWVYRNHRSLPHVLIPAGKRPRIRFRRADLESWISTHTFDFRRAK